MSDIKLEKEINKKLTPANATNSKDTETNKAILVLGIVQIIGWLISGILFVINEHSKDNSYFDSSILSYKIFQSLQAFDLLFALIGLTSTSPLNAGAQLISRLLNIYVFININTPHYITCMVLLAWTFAEIIRYSFYINKDDKIIAMLRYNSFLVLYPLGITGEILAINDYFTREKIEYILVGRILQVIFAVGFCILFSHMLKQRGRYYKRIKENKENNGKKSN